MHQLHINESLGYVYLETGRFSDAEKLLKRAFIAFETLPNKPALIGACLHLSDLYERMRQYEDSRDYAKRAMNIAADTTFDKMWVEARAQLTKIEAVISRLSKKPTSFHGITYTGSAMQMVISRLSTIAATDEIALILGETGTGKELAARALHKESRRCNSPFIPFNCSALSRDLIESRLFGHRKGAFTGADRDQTGVIRAAEGGTLFLDEIGDLSLEAQGALLRFLQSGEIQPVGASLPVKADVRVIAATNRDLKQEVEAGRFRSDLYYRLNVATVLLPPLRFRAGDISALAHHFAEVYSAEYNMPVTYLSHAEIARLSEYDWPGNIRELENFIKRRLLFGEQEIEPNASSLPAYSINWRKLSEDQKQQRLIEALGRNGGNITLAARELGLSRRAVQKMRQRGKAM